MIYHSPFTIFESLGIETSEIKADQLKNLEKRLLLELELSGNISLKAGDSELTKNDILNLFEEISAGKNLSHHQFISNNPHLLAFLQSGTINEKEPFFDEQILYQKNLEEFRAFISPYLVEVVKKEINLHFNKRDFRKAFKILEITDLFSGTYKSLAFDKLAGSINQLIRKIDQFSRDELPLDKKHYSFLMHDHFISFINALPDEFNNTREKMAINLNNLGAHYQKKELRFVYMIFMALRQLNCSESMKRTIMDNSNILSKNYSNKSEEEGEKSSGIGCFSYVGILVLIIILARACGGGGFKSNSNSYSNSKVFQSNRYKDIQKIIGNSAPIFLQRTRHNEFTRQIINYHSSNRSKTSVVQEAPVSVPKKPYFAYYVPFQDRVGEGDPVYINNASDFDMVLFGITQGKNYAVGIPAHTNINIRLKDKDQVNLYIGRKWNKSFLIKGTKREPTMLPGLSNGVFIEKSQFTISQLRIFHEYRNPHKVQAELQKTTTQKHEDGIILEEVEVYHEEESTIEQEDLKENKKIIKSDIPSAPNRIPTISIITGEFASFAAVVFSEEFTIK